MNKSHEFSESRELFFIQVAGWAVAPNCVDMLSDACHAEQLATCLTNLGVFREVEADLTPVLPHDFLLILAVRRHYSFIVNLHVFLLAYAIDPVGSMRMLGTGIESELLVLHLS